MIPQPASGSGSAVRRRLAGREDARFPDAGAATGGRRIPALAFRGALPVMAPLFVVVLVATTACAPPLDYVDFCVILSRPGTSLSEDAITLPKGTVVALKASPVDTRGDIMDDDLKVTLESGNPSVLGSARLDYTSKSCPGYQKAKWYFSLWGVETGQTVLKVWVGGRLWREIPVEVIHP